MTDATVGRGGMMKRDEKRAIQVVIENLTEAQAIAIEDMLATWMHLGGLGASRWTAFFADGDGDFNPRITVDGRKPQTTEYVTKEQRLGPGELRGEMYFMDYDRIAWALRARDAMRDEPS